MSLKHEPSSEPQDPVLVNALVESIHKHSDEMLAKK